MVNAATLIATVLSNGMMSQMAATPEPARDAPKVLTSRKIKSAQQFKKNLCSVVTYRTSVMYPATVEAA